MNAIDLIRWTLHLSDTINTRLAEDMRDAPLTQPAPGAPNGGGNHPLWCLGHQTFLEAGLPSILFGAKHPLEHWAPLFASGTQPTTDARTYPPYSEVLQTYRHVRQSTLKLLDDIGEAGLDQPPKAIPPGFENEMKTAGQTILLLAFHQMSHYGQLADARRAAGRKPFI